MKPLDQNLLRPNQIEELKGEQEKLQKIVYGRAVENDGSLPGYRNPSAGGEAQQQLRKIDRMLAEQSPEPLTDAEKDKFAKVEKELRSDIVEGMLSGEEMRKCPPTAVDRHMRWEAAKMAKILRWKNIRLQLAGKDAGRDEANLEQFRPPDSGHRIMTDAIIPGLHTMSDLAKENWPLGEPTADTAVKQVARRELSEEARERMREGAAKARAAKAAKENKGA